MMERVQGWIYLYVDVCVKKDYYVSVYIKEYGIIGF